MLIVKNGRGKMVATSREYMASQIRVLREKKGISAKELADTLGNSVKTVHAWERGQGQPDADKLVAICNALSVDISDFYDPSLIADCPRRIDARSDELITLFEQMDRDSRDALMLVAQGLVCVSQGAGAGRGL